MNKLLAILTVVILASLNISQVASKPQRGSELKPKKLSTNFDYIILRQIWPATSCMFPGTHTCAIAKNITTWVVHGLWWVFYIGVFKRLITTYKYDYIRFFLIILRPSIRDEMGPTFCNRSLPFDFDSITWILPRMLKYWPNLYTESALDSFW